MESGRLEPTALRGLVDSAIRGRGEKNDRDQRGASIIRWIAVLELLRDRSEPKDAEIFKVVLCLNELTNGFDIVFRLALRLKTEREVITLAVGEPAVEVVVQSIGHNRGRKDINSGLCLFARDVHAADEAPFKWDGV